MLAPVVWLFGIVFNFSLGLGLSAPAAVVVLSLFVTLLLLQFQYLVEKFKQRSLHKKQKLKTVEDEITRCYEGEVRYLYLRTLYRQHNYNPLNNFIPLALPVLQIPFLLAAYELLSTQKVFVGLSFWGISNLAMPDSLLILGGAAFNILPLIMTVLNMLNVELTPSDKPSDKSTLRLLGVAFFVALYMMPAALVLYWTFNNLFQLLVTFVKSRRVPSVACRGCIPAANDIAIMASALMVYLGVQYFNHPDPKSAAFAYYKLASALVLLVMVVALIKSHRSQQNRTSSPLSWTTLFMLAALPIMYYAHGNIVFVDAKYFGEVALYIFLPMLLLAYLSQVIQKHFARSSDPNVWTGALLLTFSLMPLWLNYTNTRAEEAFWYQVLLLALVYGILKTVTSKNSKLVSSVILVLFIYTTGRFAFRYVKRELTFYQPKHMAQMPANMPNRVQTNRPDVYFLIYDAYIDEEVSTHFGINNSKQMKFLRKNNFKVYNRKLSLQKDSLSSISSTYMLGGELHLKQRRVALVGHNIVDLWFKSVGYDNYYIADDYFFRDQKFGARSNIVVPEKSVNVLLVGLRQGQFKFDAMSKGLDYPAWKKLKHSVFVKTHKPKLVYAHSHYPQHTQNSGACLPNEVELFKERLAIANQEMKEDIELILKTNPNSIIITAGDHGVYFTGDCMDLEDYSPHQITGEHMVDRYGVHIAIRWPDNDFEEYDNFTYLQGVLAAAIGYISKDSSLLQNEIKRDICLNDVCASNDKPLSGGVDQGKMLFDTIGQRKK